MADVIHGNTGSAIGAIIANVGFVEQFGTVRDANDAIALDAQYIAIWGGVQSAATVAEVLISPQILDKMGRKALMYTLTINVVIVSLVQEDELTSVDHPRACFQRLEGVYGSQIVCWAWNWITRALCHDLHVRDRHVPVAWGPPQRFFSFVRPGPVYQRYCHTDSQYQDTTRLSTGVLLGVCHRRGLDSRVHVLAPGS